jgi:hypothetical protein
MVLYARISFNYQSFFMFAQTYPIMLKKTPKILCDSILMRLFQKLEKKQAEIYNDHLVYFNL